MKVRSLVTIAGVALVSLLFVSLAPAATQASTTVNVTMKEFKFTLSKSSVKGGTVVFKLANKGKLPHDIKIGGKKSKLIMPGKSGTFTVMLGKGKQAYLCTVAGHAAAGMKGTLKVT